MVTTMMMTTTTIKTANGDEDVADDDGMHAWEWKT